MRIPLELVHNAAQEQRPGRAKAEVEQWRRQHFECEGHSFCQGREPCDPRCAEMACTAGEDPPSWWPGLIAMAGLALFAVFVVVGYVVGKYWH